MSVVPPGIVLERLHQLPGGEALLELAAGRDDVELVGGAVRDLLLDRTPRELDVVVGDERSSFGDAASLFARELAARLDTLAGANEHKHFGTALVEWDGGRIDVADPARRGLSHTRGSAGGARGHAGAGSAATRLYRQRDCRYA